MIRIFSFGKYRKVKVAWRDRALIMQNLNFPTSHVESQPIAERDIRKNVLNVLLLVEKRPSFREFARWGRLFLKLRQYNLGRSQARIPGRLNSSAGPIIISRVFSWAIICSPGKGLLIDLSSVPVIPMPMRIDDVTDGLVRQLSNFRQYCRCRRRRAIRVKHENPVRDASRTVVNSRPVRRCRTVPSGNT